MIAIVLCELGCEPGRVVSDAPLPPRPGSPATTAASTALAPAGSSLIPSKLRVRPLAAGYGGVGPATPAPYPDTWVVLLVDIETTGALTGVEVKELELVDEAGIVVARAGPPWSLRRDLKTITDVARRSGDFSEVGTSPFNGEAEPGRDLRLRVHAPLDTRSESRRSQPVRFRALILASGDPGIRVEGPLQGPWPTG